jgi:glycosyltransferase involved in cell wall biosynthesis
LQRFINEILFQQAHSTMISEMNNPGSPIGVSIIIPAFNEAEGIGSVLTSLCQELALQNAEIIVVDDKSEDATCQEVARFSRVRLVKHRINKGYSSAIVTGVKASSGKYVIWFDADGQHRTEDLVKVMQTLQDNDLDYCIGVRDKGSYHETNRQLGKFILWLTVQVAAGRSIRDFNSGLRGFKREVLMRYLHLFPKGFGASTTTTLLMHERGYYGEEVPIVVLPRVGKSSVKQLRDGIRTLMIVLRIVLLFKPMRFFGSIGTFLILLGGAYGLERAISSHQGIPVLAALVIILGIQVLFFGLISDQISNSRLEMLE